MKTGPKPKPIEELFWPKVDKRGPDECWEWTAGLNHAGYGRLKNLQAHRVSYELAFGPIPDGLHICHKCDNPKCVNPNHLFAGTRSDNMSDCVAKGRLISPVGWKGAEHPNSVIDISLALEIRDAYQITPNQKDLARQFGISNGSVYAILSGRHWTVKGEPDLCSQRGTKRRWHSRP